MNDQTVALLAVAALCAVAYLFGSWDTKAQVEAEPTQCMAGLADE